MNNRFDEASQLLNSLLICSPLTNQDRPIAHDLNEIMDSRMYRCLIEFIIQYADQMNISLEEACTEFVLLNSDLHRFWKTIILTEGVRAINGQQKH